MDPSKPRGQGRPYGGLFCIIPKNIAFKTCYLNERCISVLLTDYDYLLSNVYLPYNDSRKTVDENVELMSQAIGHITAAHDLYCNTSGRMIIGDFNVSPNDFSKRAELVAKFLNTFLKRLILRFLSFLKILIFTNIQMMLFLTKAED